MPSFWKYEIGQRTGLKKVWLHFAELACVHQSTVLLNERNLCGYITPAS